MYNADTRNTYARLYKQAAAELPPSISQRVMSSMSEHPLVVAALALAAGHTIGHVRGRGQEEERAKTFFQGMQHAQQMRGMG